MCPESRNVGMKVRYSVFGKILGGLTVKVGRSKQRAKRKPQSLGELDEPSFALRSLQLPATEAQSLIQPVIGA